MEQMIITIRDHYDELRKRLDELQIRRLLVVCDGAWQFLRVRKFVGSLPSLSGIQVTMFDRFDPNPVYESVVDGIRTYQQNRCDAIFAIGGGSAIDVAKCIKLYAEMDPEECCLGKTIIPNQIPLIALPTTAGTGSEATRYAVVYYQGGKQSVTDISCIPQTVVFDPSALSTLPDYQRKSTMLDALCHGIESFWSVHSTEESRQISADAIRMIMDNMTGYLNNTEAGNAGMLHAANLAGQAINITQTTAGHAMCYKITSLCRIAHGHAAALCVRRLWPWMLENTDRCIDPRGEAYLQDTLLRLEKVMGGNSESHGAEAFETLFSSLNMSVPEVDQETISRMTSSVNPDRMRNHPVSLDGEIEKLYKKILRVQHES